MKNDFPPRFQRPAADGTRATAETIQTSGVSIRYAPLELYSPPFPLSKSFPQTNEWNSHRRRHMARVKRVLDDANAGRRGRPQPAQPSETDSSAESVSTWKSAENCASAPGVKANLIPQQPFGGVTRFRPSARRGAHKQALAQNGCRLIRGKLLLRPRLSQKRRPLRASASRTLPPSYTPRNFIHSNTCASSRGMRCAAMPVRAEDGFHIRENICSALRGGGRGGEGGGVRKRLVSFYLRRASGSFHSQSFTRRRALPSFLRSFPLSQSRAIFAACEKREEASPRRSIRQGEAERQREHKSLAHSPRGRRKRVSFSLRRRIRLLGSTRTIRLSPPNKLWHPRPTLARSLSSSSSSSPEDDSHEMGEETSGISLLRGVPSSSSSSSARMIRKGAVGEETCASLFFSRPLRLSYAIS